MVRIRNVTDQGHPLTWIAGPVSAGYQPLVRARPAAPLAMEDGEHFFCAGLPALAEIR
jgi:hypothetical protein